MDRQRRAMGAITLIGGLAIFGVGVIRGLSPTGGELTFIGVVRMCFLLAVFAIYARWLAGTERSRLGNAGLALAALGAPLTLVAAIAHGAIDGWDFDPFENADGAPPWYSILIALGAFAFAVGSILVGVAALRTSGQRAEALLLVAGGVLYALAIPLAGLGHALWALPWCGLGAALAIDWSSSRVSARAPAT